MDRRFKKFIALVESGSFSVAARRLKVSQPAITIAVTSLERIIGHRLIIRNKREIQLTKEGRIVYEAALRIQSELDYMDSLLASDPLPQRPLRVGMIDSIAHLLITNPSEPNVSNTLDLTIDNSERIIRDIELHRLDFGIIIGQQTPLSSSFRVTEIEPESFIFVQSVAKKHQASTQVINDWLAFNQSSTTFRLFKRIFEERNITVNPSFYSTSLDLIKLMAINGQGTALLPAHFIQPELASGSLVPLKIDRFLRPIWLVQPTNTTTPTAQSIAHRISSLLLAANEVTKN